MIYFHELFIDSLNKSQQLSLYLTDFIFHLSFSLCSLLFIFSIYVVIISGLSSISVTQFLSKYYFFICLFAFYDIILVLHFPFNSSFYFYFDLLFDLLLSLVDILIHFLFNDASSGSFLLSLN